MDTGRSTKVSSTNESSSDSRGKVVFENCLEGEDSAVAGHGGLLAFGIVLEYRFISLIEHWINSAVQIPAMEKPTSPRMSRSVMLSILGENLSPQMS